MRRNKGLIITMIVLLSVITLLLFIIMLAVIANSGLNFYMLTKDLDNTKYSETFEIDPTKVSKIEIESDFGNIELHETDGEKIIVEGNSSSVYVLEAELDGNTLEIERESKIKSIFFGRGTNLDTVIYLPKDYISNIEIEADYGNVTSDAALNGTFRFHCDYGNIELDSISGGFDLSANLGNVEIKNAQITSNSTIETDMGNIEISKTNPVKIITDADFGNSSVHGSDDSSQITLTAESNMGTIKINK